MIKKKKKGGLKNGYLYFHKYICIIGKESALKGDGTWKQRCMTYYCNFLFFRG